MEKQHTPGPWRVGINSCEVFDESRSKRIVDSSTWVGMCTMEAYPADERIANARLIAAAPELLEACVGVLSAIEAFPHTKQKTPIGKPNGGIAKLVRAAITKATE